MRIAVGITKKSIDNAIKRIEEYERRIDEFFPELFKAYAERIIDLANDNIAAENYDPFMKSELYSAWVVTEIENGIRIENMSQHATYIEFGVGLVGQQSPHELASDVSYQYDVNKHGSEGWSFASVDYSIDLPIGSYTATKERPWAFTVMLTIRTKGAPATMFLYKAVMDFAESKDVRTIAKEVAKRVGL